MPSGQPRKQGDFYQVDYFDNVGGINNTDSPFKIQDTQAVLAHDFDLSATGGMNKRFGHTQLNASPDAVTATTGMGIHTDLLNNKTVLRATTSKLQTVNQATGVTTNVIDDTNSAGTTPFSTTQPVVFSQFNTTSNVVQWMAGGGLASGTILGYNGINSTTNGAAKAAGSITATNNNAGTQNLATGTYYYAITLVKAATGSESNAALDLAVSVTNGATKVVQISLSSLSGLDTTKYSSIKLYRSAISGVSGFTAGDLVATVASSTSTISDDGTVASAVALSIPRAGNITLDNSVLPAGTYKAIATYKRRLVTAQGSTLYFSDVNKPESWPTVNTLTIPSGGPITALGVIQFNTPSSTQIQEVLAVFKERECWIVNGSNFVTITNSQGFVTQSSDIALLFMDQTGCVSQSLLVTANGFLFWIDYRGVYFWDGSNKPVYCSRTIEYDFNQINGGDMDLTNLQFGTGAFLRRKNQVVWVVSSKLYGVNRLVLKLDVRLTLMQSFLPSAFAGRILDGVFMKDTLTYNLYGMSSSIISASEILYASGTDGRIWKLYDNLNSDNGQPINFTYRSKPLDCGLVGTTKRFHKVIVWCQEGNTNNLTLNFWINYRTLTNYQSTQAEQITSQVTTAIWDQSYWDSAFWDGSDITYTPVVFNLNSVDLGTEGEALTLQMQQMDINSPVIIAGYSVIFSVAGLRE